MIYEILLTISRWVIPIFLLVIFFHAYWKGIRVYEVFIEGAQEGFWLALKLLPYIVGIYIAISLFQESGGLKVLGTALAPLLNLLGVPSEVLPLALVRPLSGPATLGITIDLLNRFGPDSFIGRLASTIDSCSDTTLYIIAVYFASVGVKNTRYALPVGLMADAAGFLASVYICHRMFS